jgi:hypothetical protein
MSKFSGIDLHSNNAMVVVSNETLTTEAGLQVYLSDGRWDRARAADVS